MTKRAYYPKFDEAVLSFIIDSLKAKGVEPWLDQGSLLGMVRDNAFISWDLDVDLGSKEIATSEKEDIALFFYRRFGSAYYDVLNNSIKINFFDKNTQEAWSVDVAFYEDFGEVLQKEWVANRKEDIFLRVMLLFAEMLGGAKISGSKRKIIKILHTLMKPFYSQRVSRRIYNILRKRVDFKVIRVSKDYIFPPLKDFYLGASSPNDIEGYLRYKYGEEWRVPVRNWDYLKDDGGVVN